MSDQVLIVAAETAARTPVEVATSLSFTPVVAASEQEAIALLDEGPFTLIAVSGGTATWQRLRDVAERKQPMARVLELPDANGDERAIDFCRTCWSHSPRLWSCARCNGASSH